MKEVVVVSHSLVDHALTKLRDKNTDTKTFQDNAYSVASGLIYEATKSLEMESYEIETPLEKVIGKRIKNNIVAVPVLRAGLAMLDACKELLPQMKVGFMGLERDEATAIARAYYKKMPKILHDSLIFILDPMLATGGSFDHTITEVKSKGGENIRVLCIVAAPEGIERLQKSHPEVTIYTAAIDRELNDKKYIVPGLGDFGDRYFGTEE